MTERAHQQIQNAERYFDPYRDKYKDLKLMVFGYADASEAGNHFQLAERRAERVADELELKGWTKEAVIVVSCSAGQPLGPNPAESRQVATDRVVTVEIEPQSGRRPKCRPATP